ncbi:MAG: hypothetical protein NT010_14325 [Proteobacteria bacterium]|nr:hypothetical protein [Pseudomonadota bacterium]
MSVLNNIMNAGCLKEDVMGMGNSIVSQQPCIQYIYPLLLGLLQNISNTQTGKDAGIVSGDPSQQQLNGGGDGSEADDKNTVDIDVTGMEMAQVQALLLLLNNISQTLSKKYGDPDIAETVGENLSDDNSISAENINESLREGKDVKFLFDGLSKITLKGETEKSVSQQLPESIAAMPVINNVYFNKDQTLNKDAKSDDSDTSSLEERIFINNILSREKILSASNQKKPLIEVSSDVQDNIEVLARNIANALNQGKNSSKEAFFAKYQKADLNAGYSGSKDNSTQALFAQVEKKFDESAITREKDFTDIQSKDLKLVSKDDDYMSFSKQDNFDNALVREAQSNKIVKETLFSSVMTEKIEKIVEQYSTKSQSMDMIVRLKINDNDTLLVGLKNDGQRVMVDVKTTNGNLINILQTQKNDIIHNLEEKNIYTNIFVDPDGNGSFERREARQENQRNSKEKAKQDDFIEFLEASVQGGA